MTHETEQVFFGSGNPDEPGRYYIAISTGNATVYGIVEADSADNATNMAQAHVADIFCKVKSISKLPDDKDIAKPGRAPAVNFILTKQQTLIERVDTSLKDFCKFYVQQGKCCEEECEYCPINLALEMIAEVDEKEDSAE